MTERLYTDSRPQTLESTTGQRAGLFGYVIATAAAVLAVAGLSSSAHKSGTIEKLRTEKAHLTYESAAKTESLAAAQAATFTAALYDQAQYPKGVLMPVLNGEVRTVITSGGRTHAAIYKDPILLATADIDAKPDTQGNFLKRGWIGIRGNDENGRAVIHAERFESQNETFVPYTHTASDIVFPQLGVYASAGQGGPGADGLIGFDVMGNSEMTNGNGTLIQPGLTESTK